MFDWELAIGGLLLTAVSLAIGVSFRAGMIWEGIGEYKERLEALEDQHRALTLRFHQLWVDLAQGEFPRIDAEEVGETTGPYLEAEELEGEEDH